MLVIPPTSSRTTCVIGLDPGSDTLGTAKLEFDIETLEAVAISAKTLKGKRAGRGSWITDRFGERAGRIAANQEALFHYFRNNDPIAIVAESPFFSHSHPSAYGVLVEVICSIRQALWRHDPYMVLDEIDPNNIKLAVGAKGGAGKDPVRDAILKLDWVRKIYVGDVPLEDLDSHSIDGIAAAICKWLRIRKEAGL